MPLQEGECALQGLYAAVEIAGADLHWSKHKDMTLAARHQGMCLAPSLSFPSNVQELGGLGGQGNRI